MVKFLPTRRFKLKYPKKFDSNKYSRNSSGDCVLAVDIEYPKELCELYNDYFLASDKIEIKKETQSDHQYKIC